MRRWPTPSVTWTLLQRQLHAGAAARLGCVWAARALHHAVTRIYRLRLQANHVASGNDGRRDGAVSAVDRRGPAASGLTPPVVSSPISGAAIPTPPNVDPLP